MDNIEYYEFSNLTKEDIDKLKSFEANLNNEKQDSNIILLAFSKK